ncbi:MAG: TIGR01458 family HAD-type hydrolase [Calditrichia bacterium]|nr:TIGR01458 family HAD-type hydrolase [Calditrichia bacterium]
MTRKIKGLLIDLDGVLYEGSHPVPGALDTIKYLQKDNIPFRLITNTTTQSRQALQTKLKVLGFNIKDDKLFSAPYAASIYLKKKNVKSIYLFAKGTTSMDFKDFKITEIDPEYVVIGDLAEDYNYDRLNKTFKIILNGAKMLALQKNRFWKTENGFTLDVGPFVALLEYATKKKSGLIGKPSKDFFNLVLKDMGLKAENVAMVGDDIEVDIDGAQKTGCLGIQVKTGKYSREFTEKTEIKPDCIINSIADIPEYMQKELYIQTLK